MVFQIGLVLGLHYRTRMRQTRHHPDQYGDMQMLGEFESLAGHVVGFLLIARLEHGHHGEISIKSRILLVLRGMHRGVVGRYDQQTSVGARHGRIHEGIGRHVQAHVLHRRDGALAAIRHTQRCLQRGLLVARPVAVYAAATALLVALYIFHNLSGGSSGIGIRA